MKPQQNNHNLDFNPKAAPLNESHANLMQSWMNLRGLDCELAEKKFTDLADNNKSQKEYK